MLAHRTAAASPAAHGAGVDLRPLVAAVLPAGGAGLAAALGMLRAVHVLPGAFATAVVGPAGAPRGAGVPAGLAFHPAEHAWWQVSLRNRYGEAALETVRRLRPAVVEVHDSLDVAARLAERLRPLPVVVILHSDPQGQRGWAAPARRTFMLAQATRMATASAEFRARLLEGVHPAMRRCDLLPDWTGAEAARGAADALDALRQDALKAWSRRLDATI
jgi:hypothetical protein